MIIGHIYKSTYPPDRGSIFKFQSLQGNSLYYKVLLCDNTNYIGNVGSIEYDWIKEHCYEISEEELAEAKGKML
jgi:hypothetical protein